MRLRNVHRLGAVVIFAALSAPLASGCEVLSAVDRGDVPPAPKCTADSDCSEAPGDCHVPACQKGECVLLNVDQGTACTEKGGRVCDADGACVECNDTSECADAVADDCMVPVCDGGSCGEEPTAMDTACVGDGGKVCDAGGACVACNDASQCKDIPGDCKVATCEGNTCGEADEALGAPCSAGGNVCDEAGSCVECNEATECTSHVCTNHVCATAVCTDGVLNGTETDLDCGGDCNGCADAKKCAVASDCATGVCTNKLCQPAQCGDGAKNGSETDVDCGGSCASKCVAAQSCADATDCTTGVCTGGVCQAPACNDAVKNGTETGKDCGGPCAAKCLLGEGCLIGPDCVTGVCGAGVCLGTCSDAMKDQNEGDVDCGGVCGATCPTGKTCNVDGDCVGKLCTANVCAPTCIDTVKNQDETDIDCGGATCDVCVVGQTCLIGSDCISNNCTASHCAPVDDEPANNTCAGASVAVAPANIMGLKLSAITDEDWFMFTATAADVGKMVHVVTTGPAPLCDPVVDVLAGADCASSVSLGGPSSDADYHENFLSSPITAAGPFWVRVYYSSFGYAGANYNLAVTIE